MSGKESHRRLDILYINRALSRPLSDTNEREKRSGDEYIANYYLVVRPHTIIAPTSTSDPATLRPCDPVSRPCVLPPTTLPALRTHLAQR
jgi:hypothetical protein